MYNNFELIVNFSYSSYLRCTSVLNWLSILANSACFWSFLSIFFVFWSIYDNFWSTLFVFSFILYRFVWSFMVDRGLLLLFWPFKVISSRLVVFNYVSFPLYLVVFGRVWPFLFCVVFGLFWSWSVGLGRIVRDYARIAGYSIILSCFSILCGLVRFWLSTSLAWSSFFQFWAVRRFWPFLVLFGRLFHCFWWPCSYSAIFYINHSWFIMVDLGPLFHFSHYGQIWSFSVIFH